MITVQKATNILTFTGNPDAYVLQTDQVPGTPITFRLIRVQDNSTIIESQKPANEEGIAEFYVHELLQQITDFDLPNFQSSQIRFATASAFYYVAEWDDGTGLIRETLFKRAIKGSWNWREYPERSTSLPPTIQNGVLSYKPFRRKVMRQVPEFVYVLFPFIAEYNVNFVNRLQFQIFYSDGTTRTVIQEFPFDIGANELLIIPVGDDVWQYDNYEPSKEITHIAVRFRYNNSGEFDTITLCELEFFEPQSPYVRNFYFYNSLGGLDSLITTGESEEEIEELSTEVTEAYLPYNYNTGFAQFRQSYPVHQTNIKVRLGYRKREEYLLALDLLTHKRMFEYVAGRMLPLLVLNSRTAKFQDGVYQYSFELEYQYAFKEGAIL